MHDRILIAAIFVLTIAVAPLAVMGRPYDSGPNTGPALAVIPPWADVEQVLAASGLREIAPLRAPFAILVQSEQPIATETLRESGVWTLLDGSLIAAICGVKNV